MTILPKNQIFEKKEQRSLLTEIFVVVCVVNSEQMEIGRLQLHWSKHCNFQRN
jgi:hypothetical protein